MNARLRAAVIAAKAQSMPKDNIQRSIDKASGGDAENYEEIRYEGFGPGGVAIIVEALTDNRNRTATNVRTAFSKNGGNLGAQRRGQPRLRADGPDRISGAAPATPTRCSKPRSRPAPTTSRATRTATNLDQRRQPPRSRQGARSRARRGGSGQAGVEAGDRSRGPRRRRGTLMKLIDALEEDDDVQTVWGNYDVPDEELEKLA